MSNKAIFDLETSGTNTETDRIVEISIVKTDKFFNVVDKYYRLINPTVQIPQGASDVHGITNERVKNAPTFAQVANEVYSFISGCDLGGFNSDRFDIPLLVAEFRWVTIREQNLNKRNTLLFEYNNVAKPLSKWCEELNLNYREIKRRIKTKKWDINMVLSIPTSKPYIPKTKFKQAPVTLW